MIAGTVIAMPTRAPCRATALSDNAAEWVDIAQLSYAPIKDGLLLPERLCCAGQHVAGSNRTTHAAYCRGFYLEIPLRNGA